MPNGANPPQPPGRERFFLEFVRIALILVFAFLLLLLGMSMVHHRFFQGQRVHHNGSIGQ